MNPAPFAQGCPEKAVTLAPEVVGGGADVSSRCAKHLCQANVPSIVAKQTCVSEKGNEIAWKEGVGVCPNTVLKVC